MELINQKKLYQADKTISIPFKIQLDAEKSELICKQVLRIKPRKQIVCYAEWNQQNVVAKLFFDKKNAKKEQQKDARGVRILMQNSITTPKLLFEGAAYNHSKLYILIYERISPVQSLGQTLKKHTLSETMPLIHQAVTDLAHQHSLGIIQRDLNLENFLISNNTIYFIDGRLIEQLPFSVTKSVRFEYLAQFFIRLGRKMPETVLIELYKSYMKNSALLMEETDFAWIRSEMARLYDVYAYRYLTRVFSQNTDFNRMVTLKNFIVYTNDYALTELQDLINNPQKHFSSNDQTKTTIHFQNKRFIVKTYQNEKGWRYLDSSRSNKAWKRYNNRYIRQRATVKPVAFIKQRQSGFKMTSYLVLEYL